MSSKKEKITIPSFHNIPFKSIDCNLREDNVETWPASKSIKAPTIHTNKSVAFLKQQNNSKNIVKHLMSDIHQSNKPLLLIKMEDFMQYEMNRPINKYIDYSDDINESRLEAFRECFDMFINEFRTYQGVLYQIKTEYENVIGKCLKKFHAVRIIENKLNTLERETKDKIEALHKNYKEELQKKDNKIAKLYSHVNEMKAKSDNIDHLLLTSENQLKQCNEQLKDANRSSNIFYNELKRMQIKYEESEALKENTENDLRALQIDFREISISYNSVVLDLKKLQEEIDKGMNNESKEKFVEIGSKLKHFQSKYVEYKKLYDSLMNDHQTLLNLYDNAVKERQEQSQKYSLLFQSNEDRERPVTPRPNWSKVVELKFMKEESIDGKSTDEITTHLLSKCKELEKKVHALQAVVSDDQLQELQMKEADMYLTVQYDNNTPKYLRFKGKIRKRRMPKREVEKLISSIWEKKYLNKKTEQMSLQDYLYDYFKCEYGLQSRVVESGYSMLSALERYRYDADCELFLIILNGELSEDVYRDQNEFLDNVQKEFELMDKKRNNKRCGTLRKIDIEEVIKKLCPAKTIPNLKKLLNALDLNDPNSLSIRYELLFKEDRDGNQGPFIEEMRDQHLNEIQDFLDAIENNLKSEMNEYEQITVKQIKDSFKQIDPTKPEKEINKYLCVGFGVSMVESLGNDLLISITKYMKKLKTILVKRTGKRTPTRTEMHGFANLVRKSIIKK